MKKTLAILLAIITTCLPVNASILDDITNDLNSEPPNEKIITIGNVVFVLPLSWDTLIDDTIDEITDCMFDNDGCYIDLLYTGSSKEHPYEDFFFKSMYDSDVERLKESKEGKFVIKETSKDIDVLEWPGFVYCLVYQEDDSINTKLTTIFLTGDGLMEVSYNSDDETTPFLEDYSAMINNMTINGERAFPEE